jgi:two-component system response regulator ResD
MSIRILVADDEPSILEVVSLYLEKEGFVVYAASDGEQALAIETERQPDLLILDIMLPGLSGWDVCRSLGRQVPVIFLTAKSTEHDKITGFSLGADDYVTKPFSPKELVARVKAVLRRSGLDNGGKMNFPGLVIDPSVQAVACEDLVISLSPKEYELLLFMARHPKTVFSREKLLANVWGYDFEGDDRTVDATIKRLRQKIAVGTKSYIHTVWGTGYKFEVSEK